jgi:hypothetical protein
LTIDINFRRHGKMLSENSTLIRAASQNDKAT